MAPLLWQDLEGSLLIRAVRQNDRKMPPTNGSRPKSWPT